MFVKHQKLLRSQLINHIRSNSRNVFLIISDLLLIYLYLWEETIVHFDCLSMKVLKMVLIIRKY